MIILDNTDKRPIYEQIVDRYIELIALGVLEKDSKMLSVRQQAVELSINPNTIQRAYMELERQGYIYSVKGRGNFVADISSMQARRQEEYYTQLDALLQKSAGYSLSPAGVIKHVEEFYKMDSSTPSDERK